MDYKPQSHRITPRIIIHGGAGNILPSNLPPATYRLYASALLRILSLSDTALQSRSATALDIATLAVSHLENDGLFNSGHGAVFTRAGTNELEASVMVSRGYKKRGVGVMGVSRVKNPVLLAKEMLVRGERDLEGGNGEHRGPMVTERERRIRSAQGHSQIFGAVCEELAEEWGVETVKDQGYYFVKKRWDEHIAGLEREKHGKSATWDAQEYVSQGTCGAVVLDAEGVLCVATSTGGMTNKLPGRIGDTPTLGAGFWAEEWMDQIRVYQESSIVLPDSIKGVLADCLPGLTLTSQPSIQASPIQVSSIAQLRALARPGDKLLHGVAISGTGNGDSFLRTSAVHSTSCLTKYGHTPLGMSLFQIVGPGGELEQSAGNRWKKTGEGEGGMIGIEFGEVRDREGKVKAVASDCMGMFNCGGMFRAWVDGEGKSIVRVWRGGPEEEDMAGYSDEDGNGVVDEKGALLDI